MKHVIIACTLIIQMILVSFPAAAQVDGPKPGIGLGPRIGYYKSAGASEGAYYFGAQARLRLGSSWAIEGAIDYRTKESYNYGSVGGEDISVTVRSVPLTVSAIFTFPLASVLWPYGVAGIGWYHTIIDYSAGMEHQTSARDESSSTTGYHFGLGLEIPFSSSTSLHVDYRYLFIEMPVNGLGDLKLDTKDSNGSLITAGLTFGL